ncbi:MAG TPA: signal recognition particle receptor subunit alpha, partial [Solirubrobacterales bacterium]|nr:signal recognition particle receptor subunit alpha [Solirubrobacterales bacterium]
MTQADMGLILSALVVGSGLGIGVAGRGSCRRFWFACSFLRAQTQNRCHPRKARLVLGPILRALMAREWNELFVVDGAPIEGAGPDAAIEAQSEEERPKRRFFKRLRENMSKTRQALGAEIQATMFERLDDEAFERLEEALIYADVGAPTTASIVERLEGEAASGDLESGEDLTRRLKELLAETARVEGDTIDLSAKPTVILMVGVNGTGKTTTIGKIAWHLQQELGRSVLLAAGDTFRAAAAEQLEVWAERAGCDIVRGREGSDPGSV